MSDSEVPFLCYYIIGETHCNQQRLVHEVHFLFPGQSLIPGIFLFEKLEFYLVIVYVLLLSIDLHKYLLMVLWCVRLTETRR